MGVTVQKRTVYPAYQTKNVEYDCKCLRSSFEVRHMREEDGGLVCAEGAERIYSVPRIPTALFAVKDEIFIWSAWDAKLYRMGETETAYNLGQKPNRLVAYTDGEGEKHLYALCGGYVAEVTEAGTKVVLRKGGTCGAVFKERLFAASGDTVYYSAPLSPVDWSEERGKGGYIQFPSGEMGEFVDVVAFREQLFFFRERGILQLRVNGDEFNFKAIPFKFGGGTIVKDTVADCGDRIVFFTDRGLCSFSGGKCTAVEDSLVFQIKGTPQSATALAGKYYAACTHKTLKNCLYCYDPQTGASHFIKQNAEYVAAGRELIALSGSNIYRLSPQGLPASGACTLTRADTDFGLTGRERVLDGVTVQGRGRFVFAVSTEQGQTLSAEGSAGEFLRLPVLARGGRFGVSIKADGTDFAVQKLTFRLREGKL